jgi:hypothetical protein
MRPKLSNSLKRASLKEEMSHAHLDLAAASPAVHTVRKDTLGAHDRALCDYSLRGGNASSSTSDSWHAVLEPDHHSLKHSLLARFETLSEADQAEVRALLEDLVEGQAPNGTLQEQIVAQLAINLWRSRHALEIENQVYTYVRLDGHTRQLLDQYDQQRVAELSGSSMEAHPPSLIALRQAATDAAPLEQDTADNTETAMMAGDTEMDAAVNEPTAITETT